MTKLTRGELAVLLVAAMMTLWNLWATDLWSPDEPYFGEGAREMVVDGQWLVPHVGGVVTTDKPPLFFWLIALLSLPAGVVSSLTARLPSALAALVAVALTMRLARQGGSGERTSLLAGLMLATTLLFVRQARAAQIDALLTTLVLVALAAFAAWRAGRADGRRAGWLFWSAAALAVLAKGPVGLLLPLGIALVTWALDRPRAAWRSFAPVSGPLLFLLLAAPWAVASTLGSHGEYSVLAALEKHFVERAVFGMHHVAPPWYYLESLPLTLLPWTGVVAGGLVLAGRRRRDPFDRLLLVWAGFVVLVFSLSTEKRDLYVLPAFPALALAGARLVGRLAGWERAPADDVAPPSRRWVTLSLGATGVLLALAGAALPVAAHRAELGVDLHAPVLAVGVALVVGGVAMLLAAARGRLAGAVAASATATAVLVLTVATFLLPALDPVKSVRRLAGVMAQQTRTYRAAGGEVLSLGLGNLPRAFAFYGDGVYCRELDGVAALAARLERGDEIWLLAPAARLAELSPTARSRAVEIDRTRSSKIEVVLVHFAAAPEREPA